MKTLVLANQKGGVGKSAIATQLAFYLNRVGYRVLVIDLDHQQNTSRPLRAHGNVVVTSFTASDIFEPGTLPGWPDSRFVLVAGDDRLSGLEREAARHNDFATRFRAALKAADHFDIVIVDTNPNPDIRYAAALISADFVLAPLQLNQEAIEGIAGLLGHPRYGIGRIQAALNPGLRFLGILPNMVEPTPFQRANLQLLVTKFGARLISRQGEAGPAFAFVQKRSAIAEAQAAGVFLGDMTKTAARDAWREVRPVFEMITDAMALAPATEVSA